MNRFAWIAVFALTGLVLFLAGDLLNPEPVPVAGAVELSGTAPPDRLPPEGFVVVPPRIVEFRADSDGSDDSLDPSEDPVGPDDSLDESPDDSPDELGDEDDSVDDDD